ncbi:hypothetical protein KKC13_08745 [bacterium]|nr:hypothetical protein [bacterium]MBU1958621.1 hypothetical protein [bacterium]
MTREEKLQDMMETTRMASKQEMSISFDRLEFAMSEILNDFEKEIKQLEKDRDYWKLSFHKQVEATR